MSSFVLLTKYGPPDLIVEVGTPISQDPVMLSGLFQAIISFTDEVAQAPLQVLQTKGFTVQFKHMSDDYRLIVGTNHTVLGLDLILDQISELVKNGFEHDIPFGEIEESISEVLHNYVEFTRVGDSDLSDLDHIPDDLHEMFTEIPLSVYEVLFYGLLSGYPLQYPKTKSMDLNRNLVKFIQFIEQECCSDLDPNCKDSLIVLGRDGKFRIVDHEYHVDKLPKIDLIKNLLKLVKEEKYLELKMNLISEIGTLNQMQHIFLDFDVDDHTPAEQEKIDDLRYMLGSNLEYFLLLRIRQHNQELVEYLQKNTKQTEWMSNW